eukprot:ANDGO_04158.mRNA.1 hypothetical protein EMIHUDRAFT_216696
MLTTMFFTALCVFLVGVSVCVSDGARVISAYPRFFGYPSWDGLGSNYAQNYTSSVVTWGDPDSGANASAVSARINSGTVAVFSNKYAFAALHRTGSITTWGDAQYGGSSSSTVSSRISSSVVSVFGNEGAFAALKLDGSVVTWGDAGYGGDSSGVADLVASNVQHVYSTKSAFAAVKSDGSVVTWGDPSSGGDSSAVANKLTSDVSRISATCCAFAALKSDLSVVTWGSAMHGGHTSSTITGVRVIVSTDTAFAAIKLDGSVVAWGNQTGGGDVSFATSSLSSGVVAVYPSSSAFAALKSDSSLVVWGGDAAADTSLVASHLQSDIVSVTASSNAFAAVKRNGSVVAWGLSTGGGTIPTNASTQLLSGVVAVYSSHQAFAALKQNGTVVAWGNPLFGGNATEVHQQLLIGAIDVFPGYRGFSALKDTGELVTWGGISITGPLALYVTSGVIAVSSTSSSSAALRIRCYPGTYSVFDGLTSSRCVSCPVGMFGTIDGALNPLFCSYCPGGTFSNVSGIDLSGCHTCPAGTYSNGLKTNCSLCPKGTYGMEEGANSNGTCAPCPAGSFSTTAGSPSCSHCPMNFYSFATGALSANVCMPCPEGLFTNTTGASYCIGCNSTSLYYNASLDRCVSCSSDTVYLVVNANGTGCRPCTCKNGGECVPREAICVCRRGYSGEFCEHSMLTPTPAGIPAEGSGKVAMTAITAIAYATALPIYPGVVYLLLNSVLFATRLALLSLAYPVWFIKFAQCYRVLLMSFPVLNAAPISDPEAYESNLVIYTVETAGSFDQYLGIVLFALLLVVLAILAFFALLAGGLVQGLRIWKPEVDIVNVMIFLATRLHAILSMMLYSCIFPIFLGVFISIASGNAGLGWVMLFFWLLIAAAVFVAEPVYRNWRRTASDRNVPCSSSNTSLLILLFRPPCWWFPFVSTIQFTLEALLIVMAAEGRISSESVLTVAMSFSLARALFVAVMHPIRSWPVHTMDLLYAGLDSVFLIFCRNVSEGDYRDDGPRELTMTVIAYTQLIYMVLLFGMLGVFIVRDAMRVMDVIWFRFVFKGKSLKTSRVAASPASTKSFPSLIFSSANPEDPVGLRALNKMEGSSVPQPFGKSNVGMPSPKSKDEADQNKEIPVAAHPAAAEHPVPDPHLDSAGPVSGGHSQSQPVDRVGNGDGDGDGNGDGDGDGDGDADMQSPLEKSPLPTTPLLQVRAVDSLSPPSPLPAITPSAEPTHLENSRGTANQESLFRRDSAIDRSAASLRPLNPLLYAIALPPTALTTSVHPFSAISSFPSHASFPPPSPPQTSSTLS